MDKKVGGFKIKRNNKMSREKNNLMERYVACFILHALGDTIGYKNGEWEFKLEQAKGLPEKATREHLKMRFENIPLEKMYEFIALGGINHVPKEGWLVSDDTILHMKTAEALLDNFASMNSLGESLAKRFIESYDLLVEDRFQKRAPGPTTLESIQKLSKGVNWNEIPYNFFSGGSGASMRNLCVGLAFYGKENRGRLVQTSIEASRITHNSAVGYLGGMVSALFTAFAVEDIEIKKWPFMLMEMFESGSVAKCVEKMGRDIDKYHEDAHVFVSKWAQYVEDKFDSEGNPKKRRSDINLVSRNRYYHENYEFLKEKKFFPGAGGDDSVIIAYDCLLDAELSWERLVVYAMLHAGDTDTTGCIAAGWWGAFRGFTDLPPNATDHLEFRKELEELGNKMYKKFGPK